MDLANVYLIFIIFLPPLNSDIMVFDIDILTCDYKKILDNVSA